MTPTPKLPTNRSELNDLKKQKGPKRGPSTFQRSVAAFCMVLHPQQHLAGVVRKKLGLTLQSEKLEGERRYRVMTQPSNTAATEQQQAA